MAAMKELIETVMDDLDCDEMTPEVLAETQRRIESSDPHLIVREVGNGLEFEIAT